VFVIFDGLKITNDKKKKKKKTRGKSEKNSDGTSLPHIIYIDMDQIVAKLVKIM
jgi:hypothetical protein